MTSRIRLSALVALVVLMAVLVVRLQHERTAPAAPRPSPSSAGAPASARPPASEHSSGGFGSDIGFRDREHLVEHFHKHGSEFQAASPADYLARAQALRDRSAGGAVLEFVRADGVVTRFDRASGAFIAFGEDGTIRTFFRPNDGEAYFRRQRMRTPRPG